MSLRRQDRKETGYRVGSSLSCLYCYTACGVRSGRRTRKIQFLPYSHCRVFRMLRLETVQNR